MLKLVDILKFSESKMNISPREIEWSQTFLNTIHGIATEFVDVTRNRCNIFNSEPILQTQQHYIGLHGCELFTFGFSLDISVMNCSADSSSFYVLGVAKDGEMVFYSICDDLIGNIKLKLYGFELMNDEFIIWGAAQPCLGYNNRSKFILVFSKDGQVSWFDE